MSIGLIGTKLGMTREFMTSGQSVPVTVIKIEKGRVLDLILKEKKFAENLKLEFIEKEILVSDKQQRMVEIKNWLQSLN